VFWHFSANVSLFWHFSANVFLFFVRTITVQGFNYMCPVNHRMQVLQLFVGLFADVFYLFV